MKLSKFNLLAVIREIHLLQIVKCCKLGECSVNWTEVDRLSLVKLPRSHLVNSHEKFLRGNRLKVGQIKREVTRCHLEDGIYLLTLPLVSGNLNIVVFISCNNLQVSVNAFIS
ncbi:hypothetical protein M5689_017421 [Euphorbia peplus]|nr:hypothetical protein M5689_017421 [Euphorbia peplus]